MTTLIADKWRTKRRRASADAVFSPLAALPRILTESLALQRDRWILWLPIASLIGAALWLAAPSDPPIWAAGGVFVASALATAMLALWPGGEPPTLAHSLRQASAGVCALVAFAALGAGAAQLRTALMQQAPFVATADAVSIEGWVVSVEPAQDGTPRLRLLVRDIAGVAAPPRFVRISVPAHAVLTPGRAAHCRAVLGPPAGPMAPGAYDFARRAFFDHLGATGFGFGPCHPGAFGAPDAWYDQALVTLAAMRADLSAAIQDMAPGRGGAIAAALVTGDQSGVDAPTNLSLRNSGLGHLLSVSGVHMSVVGGLAFAALLWALSLIGPLALRWPVKKIAAAGALIVLGVYLIASGSSVPAVRSYVMAAVAFGAILLDRPAISMRGLALAALITVLIFPDSVLEPGFQMSFAATMALVALFEVFHRTPEQNLPTPGLLIGALQKIGQGLGGVILVSFVAGIATDPFAIYHFQRFSIYSLASNLAIAPIMSFLVAPAAGIAAIAAPFGLAEWPLKIMASALDLVAAIGDAFGNRPEAVRALPRPPDAAFALCVLGLMWACLWRGHLRWGGLAFVAAGIALYLAAPLPVAAFDIDMRTVFARSADTPGSPWTLMSKAARSTYGRDRLGSMLGISPPALTRLAQPENCTAQVCTWRSPRGLSFALAADKHSAEGGCVQGAIVLARAPAPAGFAQRCGALAVIDAQSLTRSGGGFIYETPHGFAVTRVNAPGQRRPWTPRGAGDGDE